MDKKITFLICMLMAMVWMAGCCCPEPVAVAAPAPVVAPAPPPVVEPPPPAPAPQPVEKPAPSKKLKKRVIKQQETEE